jgi:hypothetical protein
MKTQIFAEMAPPWAGAPPLRGGSGALSYATALAPLNLNFPIAFP